MLRPTNPKAAASQKYIRGRPAVAAFSRRRKTSWRNAFLRLPRLPSRMLVLSWSSLPRSGDVWLADIWLTREVELVPPASPVPTTAEQQNHKVDDQKCGGIHVSLHWL